MENQQTNLESETLFENENVTSDSTTNSNEETNEFASKSLSYNPIPVGTIEKKPKEKKGIKGILSAIWGFIKKHKKLSIFLVILVVIIIYIAKTVAAVNSAMGQFADQTITTELQKMDLVSSVSVTGSLISADDRQVSTNLGNIEIESVSVKVGDYVQAGQTIVTFVSDDLEYELQNSKDQAALNNFKAAHALDTANENVADANEKYTQDAASTQQDVNVKYAEWQKKVKAEEEARLKYEYAKTVSANTIYEIREEKNYQAAQQATWTAYADYYGRLNDQTATMKQDAENIEESTYNQTATQMENNLAAKQQTHTIAEVEEKLGKVVVSAPISGVITAVNVKEGDAYNGTVLFEIQDLNNMVVDATVEEYDIADIYNDLTAVVKTDATDDTEFHGVVSFVSPIPTSQASAATAGVSTGTTAATYQVKIDLSDGNDRLRVGMTAKTSIILDEKKDVFAVAYDAIKEDENGTYIEVVDDSADSKDNKKSSKKDKKSNKDENQDVVINAPEGADIQMPQQYNTKKIYVTKGMESDYYVEIISDELVEGLQVVSTLETNTMADVYDIMYGEGE